MIVLISLLFVTLRKLDIAISIFASTTAACYEAVRNDSVFTCFLPLLLPTGFGHDNKIEITICLVVLCTVRNQR